MMDELRLTMEYLSEINRNLNKVEIRHSNCFEAVKSREMFTRINERLKDMKITGIEYLTLECEELLDKLRESDFEDTDQLRIIWLKALICKIKRVVKKNCAERNWGILY